jgi:hypothetical protein
MCDNESIDRLNDSERTERDEIEFLSMLFTRSLFQKQLLFANLGNLKLKPVVVKLERCSSSEDLEKLMLQHYKKRSKPRNVEVKKKNSKIVCPKIKLPDPKKRISNNNFKPVKLQPPEKQAVVITSIQEEEEDFLTSSDSDEDAIAKHFFETSELIKKSDPRLPEIKSKMPPRIRKRIPRHWSKEKIFHYKMKINKKTSENWNFLPINVLFPLKQKEPEILPEVKIEFFNFENISKNLDNTYHDIKAEDVSKNVLNVENLPIAHDEPSDTGDDSDIPLSSFVSLIRRQKIE